MRGWERFDRPRLPNDPGQFLLAITGENASIEQTGRCEPGLNILTQAGRRLERNGPHLFWLSAENGGCVDVTAGAGIREIWEGRVTNRFEWDTGPNHGILNNKALYCQAAEIATNCARRMKMEKKSHLYVLWTNDNPITAEKMVFMYTINSLVHGWWDEVTLIIWGATAKLVAEDPKMQELVQDAIEAGVYVTACKACADQLGVRHELEKLKVEVKYWGMPLTDVLKNGEKLLTL